jgi:uncharacterized protein
MMQTATKMQMGKMLMSVFVSLLLWGCAQTSGYPETTLVTISSGKATHKFTAEVAGTFEQQQKGLMFRTKLADDGGMLFPFPAPKIGSFWMHNTQIPLDIFFIRSDGTIDRIAENTVPMSDVPIVSGGEVSAVLELNGGTAARLNIDEKAIVRWSFQGKPAP